MVQREVADRFFADPSTKAYGAVSVLVQLVTEKTGFHPVSRSVFRPQPNVDSALVAFTPDRAARGLSPTSSGSSKPPLPIAARRFRTPRARRGRRAGACGGGAGDDRPSAGDPRRSARAAGVHRPGRGAPMSSARATAKINLALVVGPLRGDGKHEVATVLQRIDLADGISLAPGPSLEIAGFPEDTLVRDALLALAEAAASSHTGRVDIEKRIPVGAGLGGGSSDAATALRLANEPLPEPLDAERSARDRGRDRRRRPVLPDRRPAARNRRRHRPGAARASRTTTGSSSCCRPRRRSPRRRRSTRRSTSADGFAERQAALREAITRPATSPGCPPTTSRPRLSPRSSASSAPSARTSRAQARPSTGSSPGEPKRRPHGARSRPVDAPG